MSALGRGIVAILLLAIFAAAIVLEKGGVFGWTLFVILPAALGGVAVAVRRPESAICAAGTGALSTAIASCSLLLLGIEGLGCVIMALPLVMPLGAMGGLLIHYLRTRRPDARGTAMLLLLPSASLTFDLKVPPTVFAVHSEVIVRASP